MLIIRKEQREALLCDLQARQNDELAQNIKDELRTQRADILKNYDEKEIDRIILEIVCNCCMRDITDEDQILNICYIRFNTNMDIFSNDSFLYILNNELMHPYAKARHLILSFYAIAAMKKGT